MSNPLHNHLVTIFGGGGFIGKYITQHLLAAGARVRIAERNPGNAHKLKPLGNLGQTQFVVADIRKADSVARAVQGSDAVINLVGILNGDFESFHVDGARNVAEAASAAGCKALVQMSAIGADPHSDSKYGKSKGDGEQAVLNAFKDAVILRPSIVFGPEDGFTNRFAGMISMLPIVPVIGGSTNFQPVYVDDVAKAVHIILKDLLAGQTAHKGRIYELGGPDIISMRELNERIAQASSNTPAFIAMPDMLSGLMANVTGWLPGAPMTRDQWIMLQQDNVVAEGAKTLKTLGVAATPLSAVIDEWMVRYRPRGRFEGKNSDA